MRRRRLRDDVICPILNFLEFELALHATHTMLILEAGSIVFMWCITGPLSAGTPPPQSIRVPTCHPIFRQFGTKRPLLRSSISQQQQTISYGTFKLRISITSYSFICLLESSIWSLMIPCSGFEVKSHFRGLDFDSCGI